MQLLFGEAGSCTRSFRCLRGGLQFGGWDRTRESWAAEACNFQKSSWHTLTVEWVSSTPHGKPKDWCFGELQSFDSACRDNRSLPFENKSMRQNPGLQCQLCVGCHKVLGRTVCGSRVQHHPEAVGNSGSAASDPAGPSADVSECPGVTFKSALGFPCKDIRPMVLSSDGVSPSRRCMASLHFLGL